MNNKKEAQWQWINSRWASEDGSPGYRTTCFKRWPIFEWIILLESDLSNESVYKTSLRVGLNGSCKRAKSVRTVLESILCIYMQVYGCKRLYFLKSWIKAAKKKKTKMKNTLINSVI